MGVDVNVRELRLRDTKTGPRTVPLSPAAVQLLAGLLRSAGRRWVIPDRKPGTHMVRLGNAWRLLRRRASWAIIVYRAARCGRIGP